MVKWKYNPPHRDWNYSCHFSSDDKGNQSIYWCFSQLTTVIIQMTGWSDGSSAGMKIFISISFNYSTQQSGEGEHLLQSLLARRGSSDRKPESVLNAFSLSLSVLITSTSSTTTRQHFYASWTPPSLPTSPPLFPVRQLSSLGREALNHLGLALTMIGYFAGLTLRDICCLGWDEADIGGGDINWII